MNLTIRFSGAKLHTPIVKRQPVDGSPAKIAKLVRIHGKSLTGEQACTLKNEGKVSWTDHNGVLIEVALSEGRAEAQEASPMGAAPARPPENREIPEPL